MNLLKTVMNRKPVPWASATIPQRLESRIVGGAGIFLILVSMGNLFAVAGNLIMFRSASMTLSIVLGGIAATAFWPTLQYLLAVKVPDHRYAPKYLFHLGIAALAGLILFLVVSPWMIGLTGWSLTVIALVTRNERPQIKSSKTDSTTPPTAEMPSASNNGSTAAPSSDDDLYPEPKIGTVE